MVRHHQFMHEKIMLRLSVPPGEKVSELLLRMVHDEENLFFQITLKQIYSLFQCTLFFLEN